VPRFPLLAFLYWAVVGGGGKVVEGEEAVAMGVGTVRSRLPALTRGSASPVPAACCSPVVCCAAAQKAVRLLCALF
jgi:hypothetical protein